jgi:CHAT domain-containing protein
MSTHRDEDEEDDRARFTRFFMENDYAHGKQHFSHKVEMCTAGGDTARLVSASIFQCRFSLILGEWEDAKATMNTLSERYNTFFQGHPELYSELLHNQGELSFYLGKYQEAIDHSEYAVQAKEDAVFQNENNRNISIGQSCVVCGKAYWKKGSYYQALQYYYRALFLYMESSGKERNYLMARVICLIGQVKLDMKEYNSACNYLKKSISILEAELKPAHMYCGAAYNEMGKCIIAQTPDDFALARPYFERALTALNTSFGSSRHRYKASVKGNIADCMSYEAENSNNPNWNEVVEKYYEELEERSKAFGNSNHPSIWICYNKIARGYLQQGDKQSANRYAQMAIDEISKIKTPPQNTNPILLKALYVKTQALLLQSAEGADDRSDVVMEAYETARKAADVINSIRQDIPNAEARLIWSRDTRQVYEIIIDATYQVLRREAVSAEDEPFLNDCLEFLLQVFPQAKAALLLEMLQSKNTDEGLVDGEGSLYHEIEKILFGYDFSNIPYSYNELKSDIEKYRNKRKKQTEKAALEWDFITGRDARKTSATDYNLNNFYDAFNGAEPGLAISYLLGKEHMYALMISGRKRNLDLKKIEYNLTGGVNQLTGTVQHLLNYLNNEANHNTHKGDGNVNARKDVGFYTDLLPSLDTLYRILIKPLKIEKDVRRLYIIPDNILSFVPFEMLAPMPFSLIGLRYSEINYLVHHYQISYHASLAILFHNHNSTKNSFPSPHEDSLLSVTTGHHLNGMYDNTENEDLERAAIQIAKVLGFDSDNDHRHTLLKREKSTHELILKAMSKKRIIHFFAHTFDGHQDDILAILLQDDKSRKSQVLLTQQDILNARIDADLVLLSVCRGGWGAPNIGETPQTLSRAFLWAGARNIYFTFFRITTNHALEMAKAFTHYLVEEKLPYGRAIQKAKLKMIQSHKYSHPVVWASPAFMGDQTETLRFV